MKSKLITNPLQAAARPREAAADTLRASYASGGCTVSAAVATGFYVRDIVHLNPIRCVSLGIQSFSIWQGRRGSPALQVADPESTASGVSKSALYDARHKI